MPELLKNIYNRNFINKLASEFANNYSRFDPDKFVNDIFSDDWKQKELKEIMVKKTLIQKNYNSKILPGHTPTYFNN